MYRSKTTGRLIAGSQTQLSKIFCFFHLRNFFSTAFFGVKNLEDSHNNLFFFPRKFWGTEKIFCCTITGHHSEKQN